jgi:hypothetical protein
LVFSFTASWIGATCLAIEPRVKPWAGLVPFSSTPKSVFSGPLAAGVGLTCQAKVAGSPALTTAVWRPFGVIS